VGDKTKPPVNASDSVGIKHFFGDHGRHPLSQWLGIHYHIFFKPPNESIFAIIVKGLESDINKLLTRLPLQSPVPEKTPRPP